MSVSKFKRHSILQRDISTINTATIRKIRKEYYNNTVGTIHYPSTDSNYGLDIEKVNPSR